MSQRRLASLTGQSQSEVSDILSGRRVISYDVLVRVATALGVDRGWLGLAYAEDSAPPSDEEVDEDMRRRAFLSAAAASVLGRPVLGDLLALPAPGPGPIPGRIGLADVRALEGLTEQLRILARQWGGQAHTVASVAHRSMSLLQADAAGAVRTRLGSALSELHTVAGWCCFDSGLDAQADGHFRQAVDLATESRNTYLAVDAIYHAAMSIQKSAPNDSLKLLQLAQLRHGDSSDHPRGQTLGSWLHVDSAHALIMLGHPVLAGRELAASRDGWNPADQFDQADMDHVVAQAQLGLGNLDSAESFAASSVLVWGQDQRRDGVQARVTLATIHLLAGEPDGTMLAKTAIDGVTETRSVRARHRLVPLIDALEARPGSDPRDLARRARQVAAVG